MLAIAPASPFSPVAVLLINTQERTVKLSPLLLIAPTPVAVLLINTQDCIVKLSP